MSDRQTEIIDRLCTLEGAVALHTRRIDALYNQPPEPPERELPLKDLGPLPDAAPLIAAEERRRRDLETISLLKRAEKIAVEQSNGHLTILRFTTNWKVIPETPMEREEIMDPPGSDTLNEALQYFVETYGC